MIRSLILSALCGLLALLPCDAQMVVNPYAFGGAGAQATSYPGTAYGTHADNTGIAGTKAVTLSFWLKRDLSSPDTLECPLVISAEGTGGVGLFRVLLANGLGIDDMLSIQGFPSAGSTPIVQGRSTAYLFDDEDWHHVLFSVDLTDTGKRFFYVNDGDISPTWVQYTNDTMAIRGTINRVGAAGTTAVDQEYYGRLAEVYVDLGTYTDFSVEANRRKFRQSDGRPADLGKNGEIPSGSTPEIYLPEGDPKDNRGTTADYTITGTLTPVEGPYP